MLVRGLCAFTPQYNSMSGGAYVTGWITTLFPYTSSGKPMHDHPGISDFPASMSAVFFTWKVDGCADKPMMFYAGIDDYIVDASTNTISCAFGWAVANK